MSCPNCGYCPFCKRSTQPAPVYPVYPTMPFYGPWWQVPMTVPTPFAGQPHPTTSTITLGNTNALDQ